MSNAIVPFDFQDQQVRVITIDGEPWFVAADVATTLCYTNPAKAVRDHVRAGQAKVNESCTLDLHPQTVLINEAGLYRLIMRSNMPDAERFQDWVTDEVLPTIRKTGAYAVETRNKYDVLRSALDAIEANEQRTRVLEAKVDSIEGHYGEFTALGYAKLNDLPTDRPWLARLGKRAAGIMRDAGDEPRKREDATFGSINVYPTWALDDALADTAC